MALNESDLSELLDALRAGGDIDIIRRSVELVLQALIEAEAAAVIGAAPHERTETRTNLRSDLSVHSPAELAAIEERLNNRPRKVLGWLTPA